MKDMIYFRKCLRVSRAVVWYIRVRDARDFLVRTKEEALYMFAFLVFLTSSLFAMLAVLFSTLAGFLTVTVGFSTLIVFLLSFTGTFLFTCLGSVHILDILVERLWERIEEIDLEGRVRFLTAIELEKIRWMDDKKEDF